MLTKRKKGSLSEAGDIRDEFQGKTWAEIKASDDKLTKIFYEHLSYEDNEGHVDLVDDYTHVDDFIWSSFHEFQWTVD